MKKLNLDLENCYGIRALQIEFDFSTRNTYAIYAPNGAMKTSFAQTFKDTMKGEESIDRIFRDKITKRKITNENGKDISDKNILVFAPYDEEFGVTEETSTLLVDGNLRKKWESLHSKLNQSKQVFLGELKRHVKTKKDIEKEISSSFTRSDDKFYAALTRVKDEVLEQESAPFSSVPYDTIFNEKVLAFLVTKDFKNAIKDYVEKYNELLDASTYFSRDTFNYYNAETIAKSLANNGFFDARHAVHLNGEVTREITTQAELVNIIAEEKEKIEGDESLKKKFEEIESRLAKNTYLREFRDYLTEHLILLPRLANIEELKEDMWKSYFKEYSALYVQLVEQYKETEKKARDIAEEARTQQTQWQDVIDMFNDRFFVPFRLSAENRIAVMLGEEPVLQLAFKFKDEESGGETPVQKNILMQTLSMGEKKALYILNILFEIEVRRKSNQETLFIFDDIAGSFDYRNKYAIVQYLMEIEKGPHFKLILLTHNFDFFRTVNSRFVGYPQCLMATKTHAGLFIRQAKGIRNPFVHDWKKNFFSDHKKRIASIPFLRNLIEYTKGADNGNFSTLTSLLHWKPDSIDISQEQLDSIYNQMFGEEGISENSQESVVSVIRETAQMCMNGGKDDEGVNLETKIVLSIAIRLVAEQYMVMEINHEEFLSGIKSNQTQQLLDRFKDDFGDRINVIEILQRVALMTPENIHLNSFMYEPILDMSDEHLKKLYGDVLNLAP